MIVKFDRNNPLIVTDFEGKILFQWHPKTRTQLTQKYFSRLNNLIKELER